MVRVSGVEVWREGLRMELRAKRSWGQRTGMRSLAVRR